MSTKLNKVVHAIAICIPSLFIAVSGVAKLSLAAPILDKMTEVGMNRYMTYLGMAEVSFAFLFTFNRTLKAGFFLLCCYFSGAMATEISHGGNGIAPLVLVILVCASAFIRKKEIFSSAPATMPTNGYEHMLSKSF